MDISEFKGKFRDTGAPLAEQGFELLESKWILESDSHRLVYDARSDKYGRTFQIRHLSLGLCHTGIERFLRESETYSKRAADICVLHISPSRLRAQSRRVFKRSAWRYVVDVSSREYFENCIDPVYYGGPDRQILKNADAPREAHQRALLSSLASHGITNLEESHCINELWTAASLVAKHSERWAASMSPSKTYQELQRHGENWWIANEWLALYEAAADAGFVTLE